ncbi:hypothetical protein M2368_003114 [Arthrobacter sp. JUb119]|nr:hypothetical protein [Arthrobacter sp. JUb119]
MPNQTPLNQDALARHQWAHDFNSCDCGESIPTIIDSENCVYVPNDKAMAMHQIEMATVAQPVVSSVEELDALPTQSIVACMGIAPGTRNVPVTLVWQRGSVDNGGSGWCMPDTQGQITSTDVFYFLNVNELRQELTVLYRPAVNDA